MRYSAITFGFLSLANLLLAAPIYADESVTLDGLSSKTPADWKEIKTNKPFRVNQFELPAAAKDKTPSELIVFFFGEGGGGGEQANVTRWKGMFEPPAGKKIDDIAKLDHFKVGNVDVTYFDVEGTYLFKARPMDTEVVRKPDHRMIGVIFASPKGPYYMRLTGPTATVIHHKKAFDEWLKAFK